VLGLQIKIIFGRVCMELGLVRVSWYERGSETLVCSLQVLA